MRICLIRDGETDWNLEKRIQGQIDIPLNEKGRRQALEMAIHASSHGFSAIYSSDLSRALETARMLGQRRNPETIVSLRERHFGIFQGITAEEGKSSYPEAYGKYLDRDVEYDFESGESLKAFEKRVIDSIAFLMRRHQGEAIAVVTHAGFLDIVYRRATGRDLSAKRDFNIPNCSLNWFRFDENGWRLEQWGGMHSSVLKEAAE
jgi:probable phosphoglycerate mutase